MSFLRENSESNSGAKFIPVGFATHYQATPEREGPNEDPDNERDICIPSLLKLEWLFLFIYLCYLIRYCQQAFWLLCSICEIIHKFQKFTVEVHYYWFAFMLSVCLKCLLSI